MPNIAPLLLLAAECSSEEKVSECRGRRCPSRPSGACGGGAGSTHSEHPLDRSETLQYRYTVHVGIPRSSFLLLVEGGERPYASDSLRLMTEATCVPIADRIDIKRIAQRLTARAAEKSSAFAYEYACIDQETIILHDPRLLADVPGMTVPGMTVPGTASRGLELHGDGRIPSIDLRAYAYYMTQASQKQAHERLQELGLESPLEVPPTSLVSRLSTDATDSQRNHGASGHLNRGPSCGQFS